MVPLNPDIICVPVFFVAGTVSSNVPPTGVWSSSSDSENEDDTCIKNKPTASNTIISDQPICWDGQAKQSNRFGQKKVQKLLPSFTKCGSIEVIEDLPPPPVLRISGNYKKKNESLSGTVNSHSLHSRNFHVSTQKKEQQQKPKKSITSSVAKLSCSNGASNLSKRKRKQVTTSSTTAVTAHDSNTIAIADEGCREKNNNVARGRKKLFFFVMKSRK